MFEYVSAELPQIVFSRFPADPARAGVFGHSMGGPRRVVVRAQKTGSVSQLFGFRADLRAVALPLGAQGAGGIFGRGRIFVAAMGRMRVGGGSNFRGEILADFGGADEFLQTQLKPELLREALAKAGIAARLREHPHYDHSYYFVSSFAADHFDHHARQLAGGG